MTYYFSLTNENAENFYSQKWIILENRRIFGGGVIIKTSNNGNKMFRCSLLRKEKFHTLFEIDLSEDDMCILKDSEISGVNGITLIKLTNNEAVDNWTFTLLHGTTDFFDEKPNIFPLKRLPPITKPEWSWDVKPLTMKPAESECNITVNIPKDFIPPYSVADVGAGILEDMRKMSMFESDKKVRIPEIKEVIFNKPATVVYWKDGTKTKVKCGNDEASFDREKAVAMCFLKKMFKPSLNSHWLDVINDAIQAADDKVAQVEADKAEKARIKAENIAKAEEARRKKAEKKAKELQSEIQKLETKSLDEINSKIDKKEEIYYVKPPENLVVIDSDIKKNETKVNEFHEESPKSDKKNKIDMDTLLACIKEKLTIDEIAEMNSWDKAAVARMYYKITGTKPEKKPNTYSELDALFEQGVSVDAAARRTGFSKNIVAMRYAKLQNKNNKE